MFIKPIYLHCKEAVALIRLRTRQTSYRWIIDDVYLDSLSIEGYREKVEHNFSLFKKDALQFRVAEGSEGWITGFLICVPASWRDDTVSHEIYALYVDPDCQWQDVGKALLATCTQLVQQEHGTGLFSRTLKDNTPTRAFYEKRGGVVTEESTVTLGEKDYPIVCYTWKLHDAI